MINELPTTVGFELEFNVGTPDLTSLSANDGLLRKVYHGMRDEGYLVTLTNGWRRTPPSDAWDLKIDRTSGLEAASPVISQYSELLYHSRVSTIIQRLGGKVNESCGLHVHLGAGVLSNVQLATLCKLCFRYEDAFYMLVSGTRRSNKYCQSFSQSAERTLAIKSLVRKSELFRQFIADWPSRDMWINMRSLDRLGTVEFRIMNGSLDSIHIVRYVLFLVHLIDAIKRGCHVEWGKARAKTNMSLFRSLLGAVGFYKPITLDGHDYERAQVARLWAMRQFRMFASDVNFVTPMITTVGFMNDYSSSISVTSMDYSDSSSSWIQF